MNIPPVLKTVNVNDITDAMIAIERGIDYAQECLAAHDKNLGRTTYKNKQWAETIETDLEIMGLTLSKLKEL